MPSNVSNSNIPSESQETEGTLMIDKISECLGVLIPRGGNRQDLTLLNTLLYEAQALADLVEKNQVEHQGLKNSLIIARLLTEICRQTAMVFPAGRN